MTIKLNGSYGEGGGSILRMALAFGALTGKSFEIENIRKGRCTSGLRPQHLCAVELAKKLCNAEVEGAEINSEHLRFVPGKLEGKKLSLEIGTAGSMTLALQGILLPVVFAGKKTQICLSGASDTFWSQPVDYFSNVFLPHLKKYADFDFKLLRRGYYPKGGGKIELTVKPKYSLNNYDTFDSFWVELRKSAPKIMLDKRGKLLYVKGISHASSELQSAEVAERQARAARQRLSKLGCPVRIDCEYNSSLSIGSGIALWAAFSEKDEVDEINPQILGADSLGEKGKRAEEVGCEAAENLLREIESGAPVDPYLADQILPFMALVGNSRVLVSKITPHCRTNIYVIESFIGKSFSIDEEKRVISSS